MTTNQSLIRVHIKDIGYIWNVNIGFSAGEHLSDLVPVSKPNRRIAQLFKSNNALSTKLMMNPFWMKKISY